MIDPVQFALQGYAEEVASVRRDGLIRALPGDAAERFFALGFSLEQMRQNIGDLDRCVAEWSATPPAKAFSSEVGLPVRVKKSVEIRI